MLLKLSVVVYCAVLRNTISTQPVNENNLISNLPQTSFGECCPCSNLLEDKSNPRDQEFSPTYKITSFPRVPPDDCPCRSSEADSLGSSSVFRPFLLRAAQPIERQQESKQDVKPLLQPEVGLASSVLETLQKATDEEYEDALARDAARSAAKIESEFFDSTTGNSRNSVTIVLNPREDLYTDDTIPEASHFQETRCIHKPLGKQHMVGRAHIITPSSKQHLLKRKPLSMFHKSYDMDNSASNIQERLQANCNNNLGSKLKMNPLLLNLLPNNIERQFQDNSNPMSDFGHQLRKVSPQYYDDLDKDSSNQLNNSPAARLAELKNKLRDLSETRNFKLLRNNLNTAKSNYLYNFNYKPSNPGAETKNLEAITKSPVDTFFDQQSPIVKTILKLKDVELIPPMKTTNKGVMREKNADLKFAATENSDCVLVAAENNVNELNVDSVKDDIITSHSYFSNLSNGQKSQEVDLNEDDKNEDSCEIQSAEETLTESNYLSNSTSKEIVHLQTNDNIIPQNTESSIEDKINLNLFNANLDNESKEDDDVDDAVPEMSNNIEQKSSQIEHNTLNDNISFENSNNDEKVCYRQNFFKTEQDQLNLQRNLLGKEGVNGNLLQHNNDDLVSFKEDVLKRLENLKKTIKSKLQEPEIDLSVVPKMNSENNKNKQIVTSQYISEEKTDIATDDLQKYSDSLLEKEKSSTSESVFSQEAECNTVNNFKSSREDYGMPSELQYTETQLVENPSLVKNNKIDNDDNSKLKSQRKENYLQNSEKVCDTISDDNFDTDILPINEMSSEASTFTFNAIRPTKNNNNLESALQQGIVVQPSQLTNIISPNTLQIPSLEDIRKGITDIINAGEQEVEEFRSAISDSLNESSNFSPFASANTNLRSEIFKTRPLKNIHVKPSVMSHNIYPYKSELSVAKTAPLKSITLKPLLNNKFGTREDALRLGLSGINPVVKSNLKSPSNKFSLSEVPPLTNLRELLQNQRNFKPGIEIPRTNTDKITNLTPQILTSIADDIKYHSNNAPISNLKIPKEGQHLLSKTKPESNGFLEAMNKRREDFHEKIEALHLDFNDRLTSIHDKLLDQTNLQSINVPKTDQNSKSPTLLGLDKETQSQNLLSRKLDNIERNLPYMPSSLKLEGKTKNNEIAPLKLSLPNINTSDWKHNLRKQSNFAPLRSSNIKIMFSTTTTRPMMISKIIKKPVLNNLARKPLKDKYNDSNVGYNLKGISKPYYSKYKSFGDTNNAPSELIQTKIPVSKDFLNENEDETNQINLGKQNLMTKSLSQKQPISYNNRLSTKLLESSQVSDLPNTKESSVISNMRDALRARLENITKAPNIVNAHQTMITDGTNSDRRVLSPENVKSSLVDSALKENTSYKCSMICVKDP